MKVKILSWIGVLILVIPFLAYAFPWIIGASDVFIVESGSMEPRIHLGSVIFIRDVNPNFIKKGDIITYKKNDILVTHRVIEIDNEGDLKFKTKGDASEDADSGLISKEQVVGKFLFTIPLFGYIVVNLKKIGFVLIIIPAVLIIYREIMKIRGLSSRVEG